MGALSSRRKAAIPTEDEVLDKAADGSIGRLSSWESIDPPMTGDGTACKVNPESTEGHRWTA